MQAEYQGNVWQKDDRGVIAIWDGEKWESWNPSSGLQPPPQFVASASQSVALRSQAAPNASTTRSDNLAPSGSGTGRQSGSVGGGP